MILDKERPECVLDKTSESGFICFFGSLPAWSGLRLFHRGEYYSVHGDDAQRTADDFYQTTNVLKSLGSLITCTLSQVNAGLWIKQLLLNEATSVQIWENKAQSSGWKICKAASPGNLTAVEDLFEGDVTGNSVVMALDIHRDIVGAYTDALSNKILGTFSFVDNESFSNLESLLVQLDVKEVLLVEADSYEFKRVKAVIEHCSIVLTLVPKKFYREDSIERDLNRLLTSESILQLGNAPEFKSAFGSLACLLNYLDLMGDAANLSQYTLTTHDLKEYMRLDAAAVIALNLVPGNHESNKKMNLYGLLNHCKTSQGSRLLGQWIKQPLMVHKDIQERLDQVSLFVNQSSLRQTLREEHLRTFPDLHRLAKRFQRGKGTLQDVVRVYQVVISLPGLQSTLQEYSASTNGSLLVKLYMEPLAGYMEPLSKFQQLVETTIDLAALDRHEYLIKHEFHSQLKSLRHDMDSLYNQLEPEAQKVARDLQVEYGKKLKFEKSSSYGYHLRLSRADAGKLRGKSEYIELSTQKAGVLFSTPTLRRLDSQFTTLSEEYQVLQKSLAKEVIAITASYATVFESMNQLIAKLDVLLSFAEAASNNYCRPTLTPQGSGQTILKGARHPCVEAQDDVNFIANDTHLSNEESFHIITGPNMGGKSTYIRQIGVITLMAQMGSFVPCDSAEIRIVDAILARVGAGDSQLKGLSTFMAEMLETASILSAATKDSLIIIDELGRGTSTIDGFGLAWGIAEHIASKLGCFTLFASHFHELTALSESLSHVKNYHVSAHFDSTSLTLLYQVKAGVCDQSFGIHVAQLAGFPPPVVSLAKAKARELEGDVPIDLALEMSRSQVILDSFKSDFQSIPMDDLSDDQVLEAVNGLQMTFGHELSSPLFQMLS